MTWWRYVETHKVQSTWRDEPVALKRIVVMPRGPAVSYDGWRWESKELWDNQSPNYNDRSD